MQLLLSLVIYLSPSSCLHFKTLCSWRKSLVNPSCRSPKKWLHTPTSSPQAFRASFSAHRGVMQVLSGGSSAPPHASTLSQRQFFSAIYTKWALSHVLLFQGPLTASSTKFARCWFHIVTTERANTQLRCIVLNTCHIIHDANEHALPFPGCSFVVLSWCRVPLKCKNTNNFYYIFCWLKFLSHMIHHMHFMLFTDFKCAVDLFF